jgi:hypothetical protein
MAFPFNRLEREKKSYRSVDPPPVGAAPERWCRGVRFAQRGTALLKN